MGNKGSLKEKKDMGGKGDLCCSLPQCDKIQGLLKSKMLILNSAFPKWCSFQIYYENKNKILHRYRVLKRNSVNSFTTICAYHETLALTLWPRLHEMH